MADLPHPHLPFLRATRKSRQLSVIKKISNASKLKTRLLTVAFAKDARQSCKGAPFGNKEGGANPQRYHHPPEELQGQKRI